MPGRARGTKFEVRWRLVGLPSRNNAGWVLILLRLVTMRVVDQTGRDIPEQ